MMMQKVQNHLIDNRLIKSCWLTQLIKALVYKKLTIILLYCALPLLSACSKTPVEEQLIANTRDIAANIESLDVNGVLKWLHEDFQSHDGKDRQWIQQIMMVYRLRNQRTGVTLANIRVESDPHYLDQARVYAHVALTSTISDRFLPEQGQVYQLRLDWRETRGDWQITHAEWSKLL